MVQALDEGFDIEQFLAVAGAGRRLIHLKPKQVFYTQGSDADTIFYLQTGSAKLTVISAHGKEATITLANAGDFLGEEAIAAHVEKRLASATAMTVCRALKIERGAMIRAMRDEHLVSDRFLKFLVRRIMRTQADLVDQLFNSSEKRLARILLLMAEFGEPGELNRLIPKVTQKTLAEMVGTTRSRVSFFMNRFRKLGLIDYNGRIKVNRSLLTVLLHDQLPGHNAQLPSYGEAEDSNAAKQRGSSRPT